MSTWADLCTVETGPCNNAATVFATSKSPQRWYFTCIGWQNTTDFPPISNQLLSWRLRQPSSDSDDRRPAISLVQRLADHHMYVPSRSDARIANR